MLPTQQEDLAVKPQIRAAINQAQALVEELVKLKAGLVRTDPLYDLIDDAELGAKWSLKHLEHAAAATRDPT
jgi:hypothetical protein